MILKVLLTNELLLLRPWRAPHKSNLSPWLGRAVPRLSIDILQRLWWGIPWQNQPSDSTNRHLKLDSYLNCATYWQTLLSWSFKKPILAFILFVLTSSTPQIHFIGMFNNQVYPKTFLYVLALCCPNLWFFSLPVSLRCNDLLDLDKDPLVAWVSSSNLPMHLSNIRYYQVCLLFVDCCEENHKQKPPFIRFPGERNSAYKLRFQFYFEKPKIWTSIVWFGITI